MCSLNELLELLHLLLLVEVGELVEDLVAGLGLKVAVVVESLPADSSGELEVLLLDGHSLGVDGAQLGILEETGQVALGGFLEGQEGLGLESELAVDALADGADESLEGGLGQEQGCLFLVSLDLSDGNSSSSESAGLLLNTTFSGGGLLLGLVSLAGLGASSDAHL